jgi:hypothetical protein
MPTRDSQTSPYVQPKSGLDLIGIYLETMRVRFSNPRPGFPWVWNSDNSKSTIFIEAGAGDGTNQKDARPAIFIDREAIVVPRIVIGDRAGESLQTGEKAFYTIATGQMNIDCVSKNRGESAALGDICLPHVLMSSDLLLAYFGLRDVTPITLGPTQPWEKDDTLFVTRISSEFSYDVKWLNIPLVSKIKQLSIAIRANTDATYDENTGLQAPADDPGLDLNSVLFRKIAVDSLNK